MLQIRNSNAAQFYAKKGFEEKWNFKGLPLNLNPSALKAFNSYNN
jgi:hypothetical protein